MTEQWKKRRKIESFSICDGRECANKHLHIQIVDCRIDLASSQGQRTYTLQLRSELVAGDIGACMTPGHRLTSGLDQTFRVDSEPNGQKFSGSTPKTQALRWYFIWLYSQQRSRTEMVEFLCVFMPYIWVQPTHHRSCQIHTIGQHPIRGQTSINYTLLHMYVVRCTVGFPSAKHQCARWQATAACSCAGEEEEGESEEKKKKSFSTRVVHARCIMKNV